MNDEIKKHNHLDICLLKEGGYVITDGYYNEDVNFNNPKSYRSHIVCFSTLPEMLEWLKHNLVNKPSKAK